MVKEIRLFLLGIEIRIAYDVPEPIPKEDLLELLQERGFIKAKIQKLGKLSPSLEIIPVNIAEKGGCDVIYDPDAGHIGISGKNSGEILDRIDEIEEILKGINSPIKYYQLISTYRVSSKTMKKPLFFISRFFHTKNFNKIGEIMGIEVAPFSIRFYPKNKMETIENLQMNTGWLDIEIYPYPPNPQYYSIHIVFRDESQKVKEFIKEMDNRIVHVVKLIEVEER